MNPHAPPPTAERVRAAVDEKNRSVGAWKMLLVDEDTQAWLTELRVIIEHAHGRLKALDPEADASERRPLLGTLHNAERGADACRWLYDVRRMHRADTARHHAERTLEAIIKEPDRAPALIADYINNHRGGIPLHEPLRTRTP